LQTIATLGRAASAATEVDDAGWVGELAKVMPDLFAQGTDPGAMFNRLGIRAAAE